jgi:hypothetical protein
MLGLHVVLGFTSSKTNTIDDTLLNAIFSVVTTTICILSNCRNEDKINFLSSGFLLSFLKIDTTSRVYNAYIIWSSVAPYLDRIDPHVLRLHSRKSSSN